jgi:hypothetical protein
MQLRSHQPTKRRAIYRQQWTGNEHHPNKKNIVSLQSRDQGEDEDYRLDAGLLQRIKLF